MIEDRVAAETDVVTKLSRESVAATVAELTGMITAKGMRLFAVHRPGGRGPPGRAHAAGDHAGHLRQPESGHAGDGCLAPGRARPAAQGADLGR